jgi:uncharacterized protein
LRPRFIVDQNAGKLVKLLRLIGYDTVFFTGVNDTQMVNIALAETRIILTRDTHIRERRLVTTGKVKSILVLSDDSESQIQQVIEELNLLSGIQSFSLCLECNYPLVNIPKDQTEERVPPYVWQTQNEYRECPQCQRVYWKGTHWVRMNSRLSRLINP